MAVSEEAKAYCVLLRAYAFGGGVESEYEYFFKVYQEKADAFEDASIDPTDTSWKSGISLEEDLSRGDPDVCTETEAEIEAFYAANEDAARRIRAGEPEENFSAEILGYCFDGVAVSRCVDVLFAEYWPDVADSMIDFVEDEIGIEAEKEFSALCGLIERYTTV